jgi:hypothetical protein
VVRGGQRLEAHAMAFEDVRSRVDHGGSLA